MAETKAAGQQFKVTILKSLTVFARWITGPAKNTDPGNHLRIRLLSAFFILMAINALAAALLMRTTGGTLWFILLGVSAMFLGGYFFSRSRRYRSAVPLAVLLSTVTPIVIAVYHPQKIDLTAELMWLALPLLIPGWILKFWQSVLIALSYVVVFIIFAASSLIETSSLEPLIAFILIITFLVVTRLMLRSEEVSINKKQFAERNDILKKLEESEEKFSKAFAASPAAISISSFSTGHFIDVNDEYTRFTGYTRDELINHSAENFGMWVNTHDREKMIEAARARRKLKNEEMEFRSKSGEIGTALVSTDFLQIAGQECFMVTSRDITEYKRNQKALAKSEQQMARVFRLTPQQVVLSDLETGRLIETNDNFDRTYGYTHEEVIGKSSLDINLWETPETRKKIINIIKEKGHVINEEVSFRTKSGELVTSLVSAEPLIMDGEILMVTIITDITERKQMEKALLDSEEKLYKAFQAIPESIAITRIKDRIFVDVNEVFCSAVKLPRDKIIGHSTKELGLPDPGNRSEWLIKTIQEQGRIINKEFLLNPESDNPGSLLFSGDIIDINGEPCMISIINDISKLRIMEKALKESEEKFSKVFKSIPEAIAITRIKDGVMMDVNDSFCHAIGLSHEEIIGHTGSIFSFKDPNNWVETTLKTIQQTGSFTNKEITLGTETGEPGHGLFSTEVIEINGEPCMISIINDISSIKKMEEALRESEEMLSKTFHAVPERICISRVSDGTVLNVNENFLRASGNTRENTIGYTVFELGRWDTREQRESLINKIKEQGRVLNMEVFHRLPSGKTEISLLSADIINIGGVPCLISISTDISERKRMEEALANEAIRRKILIEQSSDGIVILDQHGSVYEVNRRFVEMLGYTSEEILKLHVWDWSYLSSQKEAIERLAATGEAGEHFETKYIRKDGSSYDVEISTNGAMFSGQKLIFCVCRDITERKLAENQLRQAMAELKLSSNQLKATNKELESFSYSVSHDLRSPLRSIDGFSQALLEDYAPKLDKTARDYLNRMRNASQKMGELIDGLLKLSRVNRGGMQRETVNLSAMAQEITTRLQETNPDRQAEFMIHPDMKTSGDAQMLRVLMENLLGNAWKFTQKVPVARIEFGEKNSNGKRTFFIKDNGAGFDMAFADKLFGAFQRLHDTNDFPGTGIGLATVQRIINRHGGWIRADGAIGQGATFHFSL